MLSIVHTVSMLIQTSLPRPFRAVPAADLSIFIPRARPETHTPSRSIRNSAPRPPSLKPKSQIHQEAAQTALPEYILPANQSRSPLSHSAIRNPQTAIDPVRPNQTQSGLIKPPVFFRDQDPTKSQFMTATLTFCLFPRRPQPPADVYQPRAGSGSSNSAISPPAHSGSRCNMPRGAFKPT
jgi:hypothetical protein